MATVKTIDVALKANTSKFEDGLNRGSSAVSKFVSAVGSQSPIIGGLINKLTSLGSAAGMVDVLAASFVSLGAAVGRAMSEVDRVTDLSTELGGDPTELLALESAAKGTGITIDQLSHGLEKMTVNASAAVSGSKEMQAIFKSLNVDARAITDSNPEAGFRVLADAFSSIENPAERARLAVKLFGKGNIELLDTLTLGSKGLEEFRQRNIAWGDVVTERGQHASESWERAMGTLGDAFDAVTMNLFNALSPAVEQVASLMEKGATAAVFFSKIVTGDAFGAAQVAGWEKSTAAAMTTTGAMHSATESIKTTAAAQAELNAINKTAADAAESAAKSEAARWAGVLAAENKTLEKLRMDLTPKIDPTPLELYLSRVKDINEMFDRGKIVLQERNKLLWSAAEIAKKPTEAAEKEMAARRKAMESVLADRRSVAKRAQDKLAELRMPQVAGPAPPVAALDRGSQAAFAAFKENQQAGKTADLQLLELRKQIRLLERIAKNGIVLAGAGI